MSGTAGSPALPFFVPAVMAIGPAIFPAAGKTFCKPREPVADSAGITGFAYFREF